MSNSLQPHGPTACQAPLPWDFPWEWVAMPSSRGSSQPRDQTCVSAPPALADGFFTTSATWEAIYIYIHTKIHRYISHVIISLRKAIVVVQLLSHVWLCDPMDCSILGFPVLHHLLELAQTHVHWVSDAIQPSHSLSSPSPPAFILSQHQHLF